MVFFSTPSHSPIKVTGEQLSSSRAFSARRQKPCHIQLSEKNSDNVVANKVKKGSDGGDKSTDSSSTMAATEKGVR